MLTSEELKSELPKVCKVYGIAYFDVFGTLARGQIQNESDIDLIIEFEEPRRDSISERYFGFLHTLEDKFHRKIDLLTPKSLKNPYLLSEIDKDRLRIYG